MKNYQKGFVLQILIIIIATAVIGGGIYFLNKNRKSGIDSQNLQVFENEYLSIEHPNNWHLNY